MLYRMKLSWFRGVYFMDKGNKLITDILKEMVSLLSVDFFS